VLPDEVEQLTRPDLDIVPNRSHGDAPSLQDYLKFDEDGTILSSLAKQRRALEQYLNDCWGE
jgi:hypothetical protein